MSTTPVKVRGGGYGLDAELARRAAEKYDYDMEDDAREWIETITGLEIGPEFGEGLQNGVILCELVNKIHPGIVKRIESKSKLAFKLMENVSAFLKACRVMGVNEFDLFETVDLFELKDLGLVVRCLHALGRAVQKNYPTFDGPTLGVKESNKNERQFSEEQLTAARNIPPQISLGSMRTMEKVDVVSNRMTLGADAARVLRRPPPPPPPPSAEKVEMISRARAAPPSPPHSPMQEPEPAPPVAVPAAVPAASNSWFGSLGWPRQNSTNSNENSQPTPSPQPVQSESITQLSKSIESVSLQGSNSPERAPSPVSSATPSASENASVDQRSSGLAGLSSSKPSVDAGSAQDEAQQWIEDVLNEKFLASFGDSLKDGVMLCQLINTIKPGSVKRIQTSQMPFKQMENITAFLKACRVVGVAEFDLFETVDLFEQKNIDLVVKCLHALGRAVQKNVPEFTGPSLGVKEATVNKRSFTSAQLQEAAGAVPLFVQHGMGAERPHDFDRSASVTFGRDAAFSGLDNKNEITASTSPNSRKASGIMARHNSSSASLAAKEPSPMQRNASQSGALPSRAVWTN